MNRFISIAGTLGYLLGYVLAALVGIVWALLVEVGGFILAVGRREDYASTRTP